MRDLPCMRVYLVMSDSATPFSLAHQPPLSMGFSRQEYWSGLPCSPLGIFPTQGSNPGPLHCKEDSLPLEPSRSIYLLKTLAGQEQPGSGCQAACPLTQICSLPTDAIHSPCSFCNLSFYRRRMNPSYLYCLICDLLR